MRTALDFVINLANVFPQNPDGNEEFRGLGLGKRLVEKCVEEAKFYGINQVLSLTYEKDFFNSCEFREIPKEDIPEQKIWADCIKCNLFPICNEIAMVKDIEF